jgi:hypothetical protein
MNYNPQTRDFCPICSYSVPLAKRVIETDIEEKKVILHPECRIPWLAKEIKNVILEITNDLKGICGEAVRFCKKIKRKLRTKNQLEELKILFKEVMNWIRERINYFRDSTIDFLDKFYRKINYIAEKIGVEEEILAFPLPL